MVYIVVLNWRNAIDTIACINSLLELKNVIFRIVICDNSSPDDSYSVIRQWLLGNDHIDSCKLIELDRYDAENYIIQNNEDGVYLVQTGANLGYAGGNNVGIRFAMNQSDMEYVWVLNNDTEVEPDSLFNMLTYCHSNPDVGICGARLVYYHDRNKLQGLGGIFNPWFCTSLHFAENEASDKIFDLDNVINSIDYVIGASIFIKKELLVNVGLLCEDYFLYYEEIDLALRSRDKFKLGVSLNSVVYHKEGASTDGGKSDLADYCYIKNKLLFIKKFYPEKYFFVWVSLIYSMVNRLRRKEYKKAITVFKLFFKIRV